MSRLMEILTEVSSHKLSATDAHSIIMLNIDLVIGRNDLDSLSRHPRGPVTQASKTRDRLRTEQRQRMYQLFIEGQSQ